jgi:glycosyltransferase involved in cell wall biosynthesis
MPRTSQACRDRPRTDGPKVGQNTRMRTSVVVVLHGDARSAEQCLAALAVQDEPVTEVVLVRSATTPPPLPPDGGPVVRTVILPSWTGPHAARNVGVGESSGDFIAFVDADCVPERSWHRRLVAPLAGRTADLVGGAVACGDRRWIDRGAHRAKFGVWAPGSSVRDRPSYPTANLALGRRTWDRSDLSGSSDGQATLSSCGVPVRSARGLPSCRTRSSITGRT